MLKNFSSLKAIISGLQSNPVYRLKKAWGHLPRDKMETFQVCVLPPIGNLFYKSCLMLATLSTNVATSWQLFPPMLPQAGNNHVNLQ